MTKIWREDAEAIIIGGLLLILLFCIFTAKKEQVDILYSETQFNKVNVVSVTVQQKVAAEIWIKKKFMDYRLRPYSHDYVIYGNYYIICLDRDETLYLGPHNYLNSSPNKEKQIKCANDTYRTMRDSIWREINDCVVAYRK